MSSQPSASAESTIDAQMFGADTLVLSHFTLDRHCPIEYRFQAAEAAGFSEIGLYVGDYQRLSTEGKSGAWLDELLAKHSIRVSEIEVVRAWGDPASDDLGFETSAWEMARRWGCRYLQAIGPFAGSLADGAKAFAGLCDRAKEFGVVVGLEFLPFTNITDAATAWELVERAGRSNGGVCVDIWHHRRGANSMEQLLAIPADRIFALQLSDGASTPVLEDYKTDCLRNRQIPGDGTFDVAVFVAELKRHGVQCPLSLEVCSEGVWGASYTAIEQHVTASANGLRTILASLPKN